MSQSPQSPPTSPRRGKHVACQVTLLDDTTQVFHVPYKCLGSDLLKVVAERIHLLEVDYFDLEYVDEEGNRCWLDHEKALLKQIPLNRLNFLFLVKFYTPDPGLLEDEFTRYLFSLQIKRDLSTGAMQCQEHTAVLLASYIVQSELGDFSEEEYQDHLYLAGLKLLPHQNDDIDIKIMEHHKEHMGQNPGEADFNLLDTARKVEMYGIRLHSAKDHEGVPLALAVAHMGVLVFQSYTKINTFSWAKIRKLSFKRKKYLIKLHPEGYGYYKDTVEFYFESRNACKNFWKKCIEHHSFFRCHVVKRQPRNKTRVVSRGSSFRYSGRTQKQLVEYVRDNYVKRPPFERSTSMRTMSSSGNRSQGATPRNATLNSRDIHFGMNTSASSGSHVLEADTHGPGGHVAPEPAGHVHAGSVSSFRKQQSEEQMAPPRPEDGMKIPSYTEAMEEFTRRPPPDDATITGVCDNATHFAYNYYQLSYDDRLTNQNAHDNDDADNTSHDSYRLTMSSRDDSLERELDRYEKYEIRDPVLHIDEEKLMREIEEERRLAREGGWPAYGGVYPQGEGPLLGHTAVVTVETYRQYEEPNGQTSGFSDASTDYDPSCHYDSPTPNDSSNRKSGQKYSQDLSNITQSSPVQEVLETYSPSKDESKSSEEAIIRRRGSSLRGHTLQKTQAVEILDSDSERLSCNTVLEVIDGMSNLPDNLPIKSENVSDKDESLSENIDSVPEVADGMSENTSDTDFIPCPESKTVMQSRSLLVTEQNGAKTDFIEDQIENTVENVDTDEPQVSLGTNGEVTATSDDVTAANGDVTEAGSKTDESDTQALINTSIHEQSADGVHSVSRGTEEISYVLHKRHVDSKPPATLPTPRSRSRSKTPSPSRKNTPLTREQRKAQLEKIKTNLTSPIVPPSRSHSNNQCSRSISPKSRRAFDFVTYNKLPACDSYSSQDDSLASEVETDVIFAKAKSHEKQRSVSKPHSERNTDSGQAASSSQKSTEVPVSGKIFSSSSKSEIELFAQDWVLTTVLEPVVRSKIKINKEAQNSEESATSEESRKTKAAQGDGHKPQPQDPVLDSRSARNEEEHFATNLVEGAEMMDVEFEGDDLAKPKRPPYSPDFIVRANLEALDNVVDEIPEVTLPAPSNDDCTPELPPPWQPSQRDDQNGGMPSSQITKSASENSMEFPLPPPPVIAADDFTELTYDRSIPVDTELTSLPEKPTNESALPIPDIMIRAATPVLPSSDDDRTPSPDDTRQVPVNKASGGFNNVTSEDTGCAYSSDSDSEEVPLPLAGEPPDVYLSSEDEVEHPGMGDFENMVDLLAMAAKAKPFSKPLSEYEALGPPMPDEDIDSSESEKSLPDAGNLEDAMDILAAQACARPFAVPLSGDTRQPYILEHDVSSEYESDVLNPEAGDLLDAQQILASQAMANPYAVPRTGQELLPPPEHDVSSESESDVIHLDVSELLEFKNVLHSQAAANPFAVPISDVYLPPPPPPPPPIQSDSGSEDGNDADVEDLPEPDSDILENDFNQLQDGSSDDDLPLPPPPPPLRSDSFNVNHTFLSCSAATEEVPKPGYQEIVAMASSSDASSSEGEGRCEADTEGELLDALENLGQQTSSVLYSSDSDDYRTSCPRDVSPCRRDAAQSDVPMVTSTMSRSEPGPGWENDISSAGASRGATMSSSQGTVDSTPWPQQHPAAPVTSQDHPAVRPKEQKAGARDS